MMSNADLPRIRPLESRVPRKLQARFGGRRMEKVSTPVDRPCDCKRTSKRTPAETENLASRPSHSNPIPIGILAAPSPANGIHKLIT